MWSMRATCRPQYDSRSIIGNCLKGGAKIGVQDSKSRQRSGHPQQDARYGFILRKGEGIVQSSGEKQGIIRFYPTFILLMLVPHAAVLPLRQYRSSGSPAPPDGPDTYTPPGPAKIPRRSRHTPAPSLAVPQPMPDGRQAYHFPPVLGRGNAPVLCAKHDAPAIPGVSYTLLAAELFVRPAALL